MNLPFLLTIFDEALPSLFWLYIVPVQRHSYFLRRMRFRRLDLFRRLVTGSLEFRRCHTEDSDKKSLSKCISGTYPNKSTRRSLSEMGGRDMRSSDVVWSKGRKIVEWPVPVIHRDRSLPSFLSVFHFPQRRRKGLRQTPDRNHVGRRIPSRVQTAGTRISLSVKEGNKVVETRYTQCRYLTGLAIEGWPESVTVRRRPIICLLLSSRTINKDLKEGGNSRTRRK